jgi:hypothetical protein
MEQKKYAPGKNPNSLKNLEKGQWRPGQSGNPEGRPKGIRYISEIARAKLEEQCPYAPDKTWAEYLVDRWLGQAVENAAYFKELMDRLEGKVVQLIEGQIVNDVIFTIGKGYANGKLDIQPDKQDTE